jgi:hypothetical protein
MNDDDDIDENFGHIEAIKHEPAAPPPPAQKELVDTRTPDEIRASAGYRFISDWFARGDAAREAAREPRTIEQRFYSPKR